MKVLVYSDIAVRDVTDFFDDADLDYVVNYFDEDVAQGAVTVKLVDPVMDKATQEAIMEKMEGVGVEVVDQYFDM